jgi:hypothetical protein
LGNFGQCATAAVALTAVPATQDLQVTDPANASLTDANNGVLNGKRYLIHDHDPWFEWSFHSVIADLCADPLIEEEIRRSQLALRSRGDEV